MTRAELKAFHRILIVSLDTMNVQQGLCHLGDLGAQVLVLLRVFEKVDKLQDLQLGLLAARNVTELDLDVVLHHLGRGLAHAEGAAPATARAAAHGPPPQREEQEADEQHGGDQAEQEGTVERREGGSKVTDGREGESPGANEKTGDTHPSLSLLYTTAGRCDGSRPSSACAVSRFLSKESTLPMLNHT